MKRLLALPLLLFVFACGETVTQPDAGVEDLVAVTADQANQCPGQIVAGIASTWPHAHVEKGVYGPPPGAIAKWIAEFGEGVGINSVRELQELFCS